MARTLGPARAVCCSATFCQAVTGARPGRSLPSSPLHFEVLDVSRRHAACGFLRAKRGPVLPDLAHVFLDGGIDVA